MFNKNLLKNQKISIILLLGVSLILMMYYLTIYTTSVALIHFVFGHPLILIFLAYGIYKDIKWLAIAALIEWFFLLENYATYYVETAQRNIPVFISLAVFLIFFYGMWVFFRTFREITLLNKKLKTP